MIFGKSITAKFLTALFIILLIGQAAGAVLLILYTRAALFDSLHARIRHEAVFLAGVSASSLSSFDFAGLAPYVDEVLKDEDVTSVHITGADGKVVKEGVRVADADVSAVNPFFYGKGMTIKVPVVSGGVKLGEVTLDYAAKSVNRYVADNIVTVSLYQFIMLVTVGLIMMVVFNRSIKKPVADINQAIERVTMGDLAARIPDLGENEIGSIAKGITYLAERLSATIGKLNSTAVNVSTAISQVNTTYNNVITGMNKQSVAVKEIIKSLQHAGRAQGEISEGTENLSSLSTENVSSLIELKATAEEIASNNQRLFKATEDSYAVVAQMSQNARSISGSTSEVLSAVEDTSASVEEIGASVREVEEHAGESSSLAMRVSEITSDIGMLAIVNAVEGMDKIAGEVTRSSEIIQRLGTRSVDIEKVLSVIKDVTEQTNLLSLNAAILAAQAGEYGKSFSVVADEIRGLSERTASSTREIGGIVKTIQRDIRDAVFSIDSAQTKVEEGNGLVIKVGDALKEILTAAGHSSEMTKAIERATEEQAIGLGQITHAVEDIRKMVTLVAKAIGEQENALSYLLEGVGEVKEVAEIGKRGTEEQALGTRGISRNLELANDRITRIGEAVMNQKKLNEAIMTAMDQIIKIGNTTIKDMEEASESLGALRGEVEVLKRDVEVFKVR